MFNRMITRKRDLWFSSLECTVNDLIRYMLDKGQMRDAQIEAIKTYLFLKIACDNKPLNQLFTEGFFNNLDLGETELKNSTKVFLDAEPAGAALFEYVSIKDDDGNLLSEKTVKTIKNFPETIDFKAFFNQVFYGVTYSDYLFSLPMGAGKTFLMAAFIYLDLYFAQNEPNNRAFAHNFIIFAPSGLKTSVIPSLRTIQNFDPSWVIPEPSASELKRRLIFEVLDQNKAQKKSNKTKNPNVQKIAIHQPLQELFGLVAVTNAEKVILDRIEEKNGQINLFEDSDDDKDRQANELRNLIGKIPSLSIFIDEVHHAATDDKKLRAVVSKWNNNDTVNGVIGFSGTPYLSSAEKFRVSETLSITSIEISNIVYYYPLIEGICNFLKKPSVLISNNSSRFEIVESGIKAFFDRYRDTVYNNGTCAKLGIYCGGSIEILEEQIYPIAARIAAEYGLNPSEAVLKFHGGNKQYSIPVDSELQFASLDKPFSRVRIVPLVQIGKEGWDCRSLTGIVLSQEGDCPTNMVLQTSCRCLRQVEKGQSESALIYLNESNAKTLNMQLQQQHHISINEFENGSKQTLTTINRYNRMDYLKMPKVDFYQLKINYNTLVIENNLNIEADINNAPDKAKKHDIVKEAEFGKRLDITDIDMEFLERGKEIASFNSWIYRISKESFGFVSIPKLLSYEVKLQEVFKKITYLKDGVCYFSSEYMVSIINENIRKSFYEKRSFDTVEELVPEEASLLKVDNFTSEVKTAHVKNFFPDQETTQKIVLDDKGKLKPDAKTEQAIKLLEESGQHDIANTLRAKTVSHPMKDKSFHYLPYKTDSSFEQTFLDEILKQSCVRKNGLEVYYNGDRALTEFKIKCYKKSGSKWIYIGMYTPDFLIISRKDGKIYKSLVVETKGKIFANDPTFKDKRTFMEEEFLSKNNAKFGYKRFDYLYLEDTLSEEERITKAADAVTAFFKEEN